MKPRNLFAQEPEFESRFKPFLDFAYETYEQKFNLVLPVKGAVKALALMLLETKQNESYSLERLREYWMKFLNSGETFDREQGSPLRYFAQNVNKFALRNRVQPRKHYGRFVKGPNEGVT